MGKPKHLLKSESKSKGKRPQPVPETADEFLAAGVDHESAGEKWRAGDAAKSARFFVRALDTYQTGLQRFPQAFDLAYNKARVQLDLAQQPRLLEQLPTKEPELLQVALDAHRYALSLRPDDADTLFNTAQLLGIIAEPVSRESASAALAVKEQGVEYLREALHLLERCLVIQEQQYGEFQASFAAANDPSLETETARIEATTAVSNQPSSPASSTSADEQWTSVIEPVTPTSLLDTCIAQIQALTSLIPLVADNKAAVKEIEEASSAVLDKATAFATDENPSLFSFHCDRAKILTSLARVLFCEGLISVNQYSDMLTSSYAFSGIETSQPALCGLAEACIDFNVAVNDLRPEEETPGAIQWKHLSNALTALSAVVKLPDAMDLPVMHGQRADVELLRARLAEPPLSFSQAIKHRPTLLKNAEVFYRGAARQASASGDVELERDMQAKEHIVKFMREEPGVELAGLEGIIQDMREDGLIGHLSA